MAGDNGRGNGSIPTAAVILVLCALTYTSTCFSLHKLSKRVNEDDVGGAMGTEIRTGTILLNGKEFNSKSGSASAPATGSDGLLHIDSKQSDGRGLLETSQLGDNMVDEAAWRRLNISLTCGQGKMKLKATGPGAADFQLDMGNTDSLLLIQVPKICGYSMQQNALGLILVVPYDGCNVIIENEEYVLAMRWLKTPVKFTCHMLKSLASTTQKPARQPRRLPFPLKPWSLNRHKRHLIQPNYDPYLYFYLYNYYLHSMIPPPTSAATTTAKPDTTPVTTENPPQPMPPAYPYYYYNYYPYFYPYYPQNIPVVTITAPPTTGPVTSGMTATTTTVPTTTTTTTTTTASTSAAMTSQIPPKPYYPFYTYPYYPPAGQPNPGLPYIYYNPYMQPFLGNPPYPTYTPMKPPISTTMQVTTAPTTTPNNASPTMMPTTASASKSTSAPTTTTAKTTITTVPPKTPCTSKMTQMPSNEYTGQARPYVPYQESPFTPYVSFKAGKLPNDQKYMPQAAYKSGLQARAHPGFNNWQPVPWYPHSMGENNQFDWTLPEAD